MSEIEQAVKARGELSESPLIVWMKITDEWTDRVNAVTTKLCEKSDTLFGPEPTSDATQMAEPDCAGQVDRVRQGLDRLGRALSRLENEATRLTNGI